MRVLNFILLNLQPYKKYSIGLFLSSLLVAAINNIDPYLIKLLIDNHDKNSSFVLFIIISFFIIQCITAFSWRLTDKCSMQITANFRSDLLNNLVTNINKFSYSFFQNNLAGSLLSKINDIATLTPSLIFNFIMDLVHFGLITIITLCLLFKIHPIFALSLLTWIIIFLTFSHFSLKKVMPLAKSSTDARTEIYGYLSDYLTNIINVKLFTKYTFEKKRLNTFTHDFIQKSQRQSTYLMNYYFIQGLISAIYTTFLIICLVSLSRSGFLSAGDFSLVFMLNYTMFRHIYSLSHTLRDFISNYTTIDQHLEFFENNKKQQIYLPLSDDLNNVIYDQNINFQNVNFSYKGLELLFDNLSVLIKSGQKVGLVGHSGSGKTSFINLLLNLYPINAGEIFIGDQNITNISQESLYRSISIISQDPVLFHRTIKENIAYGKDDATEEEIIEASTKAHAHAFILNLPNGYESLVGERGIKLSGGQRQRIAIARAILRDSPILILDEATSQLDSITEGYIQNSLWQLMENKTTIVIAHRLSTVLHMDRILVFENGKIVEDGNHNELILLNGLYKNLLDTQKNGFLPTTKFEQ